jgi:hypothetical protein
MNSIGWLGGGIAPVAIAAASERYGMSACLSANSLIYLAFGSLLLYGCRRFMCSNRDLWTKNYETAQLKS